MSLDIILRGLVGMMCMWEESRCARAFRSRAKIRFDAKVNDDVWWVRGEMDGKMRIDDGV